MSDAQPTNAPLYWRLLRLRHLRPSAWQRAVLVEGSIVIAAVLVLADVASAWTMLLLPGAVTAVVKANDILVGLLRRPQAPAPVVDHIRTGPETPETTTAPPPRRGRRRDSAGRYI